MKDKQRELNEVYNIDNLVKNFQLQQQINADKFNKELKEKMKYNNVYNEFYNEFLKCLNKPNETLENIIITSPTQMGKTQMIIDTIKLNKHDTISVVVLDNKIEHFNQMKNRMKSNNIEITQFSDKNNLIFLMLNNSAQIKKLNKVICQIYKDFKFKNYHIYIDESDTFNKTDDANSSQENDPKCHSAWIQHFDIINTFKLQTNKRICISATFENNCYYQNVLTKNTFVIPEKLNYKKITNHEEWINKNQLKNEINRIKREDSNEAILYCSNYLNCKQEKIANELYEEFEIPVILYNGKGIEIFINNKQMICNSNISNAMTWVEKRHQGPVIIVGYRLMDRGISFCSNSKEKPLTATVMFYSGSNVATAVNIAQIFGRITGTSRPDITKRTIYCNNKIYTSYINYLQNQNMIYNAIKKVENKNLLLKDVINNLELHKLKRKLDRPILRSVNDNYNEASKNSKEIDPEKMHRLVDSWEKATNNDTVAKIFRLLISNETKSLPQKFIKQFVLNDKKHINYEHNLHDINHSAKWACVFELKNEYINIKKEVLEYLLKK